jgi:hypothetical protein
MARVWLKRKHTFAEPVVIKSGSYFDNLADTRVAVLKGIYSGLLHRLQGGVDFHCCGQLAPVNQHFGAGANCRTDGFYQQLARAWDGQLLFTDVNFPRAGKP